MRYADSLKLWAKFVYGRQFLQSASPGFGRVIFQLLGHWRTMLRRCLFRQLTACAPTAYTQLQCLTRWNMLAAAFSAADFATQTAGSAAAPFIGFASPMLEMEPMPAWFLVPRIDDFRLQPHGRCRRLFVGICFQGLQALQYRAKLAAPNLLPCICRTA
jgi:hypothetical protein